MRLFLYISRSIAGTTKTGQLDDRKQASSRLSHLALAIDEIVLEVAGAIIKISAHSASSTWLFQDGLLFFCEVNSEKTSLLETVDKVKGVTKSFEEGVITTLTLQSSLISCLINKGILYAAIPPETPNKIFF